MKLIDYIIAIRKANREMELENEKGFKSKNKIIKSKKTYDRSEKIWKKELGD